MKNIILPATGQMIMLKFPAMKGIWKQQAFVENCLEPKIAVQLCVAIAEVV